MSSIQIKCIKLAIISLVACTTLNFGLMVYEFVLKPILSCLAYVLILCILNPLSGTRCFEVSKTKGMTKQLASIEWFATRSIVIS